MRQPLHRVALAVATFVTILTIGGALIAEGYFGAPATVSLDSAGVKAGQATSTEVIYVRPAASPSVIHVTQTEPAASPSVVHVVVPGGGDDDANEHDGGD